jgi:hypothetical protein
MDKESRKRVSTLLCPKCLDERKDRFLSFQKWGGGNIRWTCDECGYVRNVDNFDGHGADNKDENWP